MGRREKAKGGKNESDERHNEKLDACSNINGEEGGVGRRAEDIAVQQLPPTLLAQGRCVRSLEFIVVSAEVVSQDAGEDHPDDAGEEEKDDKRVDDREPMDAIVGHAKVYVPARGPHDLTFFPHDVISPDHSPTFGRLDLLRRVLRKHAIAQAGGERAVRSTALLPLPLVGVGYGVRMDVKSDDEVVLSVQGLTPLSHLVEPLLLGDGVVEDLEAEMIVEHVMFSDSLVGMNLLMQLRADRKPKVVCLKSLLRSILVVELGDLSNRKIVQSHVHSVVEDGEILELFHLRRGIVLPAYCLAVLVHFHLGLEERIVCLFTCHSLSEVLR
mmetsp:Transcript_3707/g.9166  ORF Transcript_3707/g.9166 Transcript_3707/m.9166 type:complete len:327 (+) Transcript_3707:882-1862(+)